MNCNKCVGIVERNHKKKNTREMDSPVCNRKECLLSENSMTSKLNKHNNITLNNIPIVYSHEPQLVL